MLAITYCIIHARAEFKNMDKKLAVLSSMTSQPVSVECIRHNILFPLNVIMYRWHNILFPLNVIIISCFFVTVDSLGT